MAWMLLLDIINRLKTHVNKGWNSALYNILTFVRISYPFPRMPQSTWHVIICMVYEWKFVKNPQKWKSWSSFPTIPHTKLIQFNILTWPLLLSQGEVIGHNSCIIEKPYVLPFIRFLMWVRILTCEFWPWRAYIARLQNSLQLGPLMFISESCIQKFWCVLNLGHRIRDGLFIPVRGFTP
jgi:hypothetical protein